MKKTTMKILPNLKIQELVDTLTTFSSVQVRLNDKYNGKQASLGVFQGKMAKYNTLCKMILNKILI